MATYVQLGAVRTWYDEHGEGEPLVLLHGGLVDARFFEAEPPRAGRALPRLYPGAARPGHTPDVAGPITYQLMTDGTIAFLEAVVGQPADLVGHSDSAFVAMLVAISVELVKRLVMISGGFDKTRRCGPGRGVGCRCDRRVPGPGLRRGLRRHRPLQGRGHQGRRDGRRLASRTRTSLSWPG